MNEWFPFVRPLLGLFFLWKGIKQLRWPERVVARWVAEAERKRAKVADGKSLPPIVPPSKRRVQVRGAFWLLFGVLLLWLTPVQFRFSPGKVASAMSPSSDIAQLIEPKVAEFMRENAVPNVAVAVFSDGQEAVIALGWRSLWSRQPVTAETLFEIGSISKTFTGVLLAKMILEGKVTLETPVASLLPAGTIPPDSPLQPLTLRHLATHSSGLPPMPPNFISPGRFLRLLARLDPYRTYTERELLEALGRTKLESQPGEKGEYSNYGVSLLGWMLARQNNETWEVLVTREICAPLGMNETSVNLNREQEKKMARAYDTPKRIGPFWLGVAAPHWNLPNAFAGAGGLRSSGQDMLKYLKASMDTNALGGAFAASQEKLFNYDAGHNIGMTWLRRKPKGDLPEVIWHNGGTGGFRSFMGFTADRRHGVVILTGSTKEADGLGVRLLETLVKNGQKASVNETPARDHAKSE